MASRKGMCAACGYVGKFKRVCSPKCGRKLLDRAIKYRIKMGWYSTRKEK